MKTEEIYMQLFDFSRPTYFKRRKEQNKALSLLQKYFSDEQILEFINTGSIQELEENKNSINDLEEHLLFEAIKKIVDIPNQYFLGKKEFWLQGFIDGLQKVSAVDKETLINEILGLKTKFYESENWKQLTIQFIESNFSNYEIKLMLKNKTEVMRRLSAI